MEAEPELNLKDLTQFLKQLKIILEFKVIFRIRRYYDAKGISTHFDPETNKMSKNALGLETFFLTLHHHENENIKTGF